MWIEGGGIIHGDDTDQNSYHSKLGGRLGITILLDSIIFLQGDYHMTTVYDGLSTLNSVDTNKEYIKCNNKHGDLISITSELWERSQFNFTSTHVYARQDSTTHSLLQKH